MKIIKRSGEEVEFNSSKIFAAITKANDATPVENRIESTDVYEIATSVAARCMELGRTPTVEEVQDMVESDLMRQGAYDLAKRYITYRYTRALARKANTTDEKILSLIELSNEEAKQENSNKNPVILSTQRDYMAGEVSKDLTERILLPKEIVDAHKEGIIHFHDSDYFGQHMHNCFQRETRFLTPDGVRSFRDFEDGQTVVIFDKDGNQKNATVHCFGRQKMQKVFLESTDGRAMMFLCTADHRWYLEDGNVTTQLCKNNVLYKSVNGVKWTVKDIVAETENAIEAWCVVEPVTHSFTLEGGIVTGNCDLVNLEDMLQNGTVISGTMIEKPHSFSTACNITTQIIAQVASNQYGGQSFSLAHLAPFVDVSRQKIRKQIAKELEQTTVEMPEEDISKMVEIRLREEIRRGVQMIQYQILTLLTTNGQTPFVTSFMYLNEAKNEQEKKDLALIIEETLLQRIEGVKNEAGAWITPAFPKLIYVLEEDNIHDDSPFFYLTKLAAKCTAKRLVPDYISEKVMKELKGGDVYTCMGCRSFLTPDRFTDNGIGNIANAGNYESGKHKYYGRFNQGVVTVNLVDIGLSANKDMDLFWKIFDERMELCHRALRCRHDRLKGTVSDVAPILWQYGALARLEKGETIDKLLYDGYSTLSLGYAGLWECVMSLNGKKLTEPEGEELGLEIMRKLNEYTAKWKAAENIDYSLYGTPLESTTYKFAKALQKRFGVIDGITDKGYITNSYHIHVTEPVDAFEKISTEAKFQALSPGGAISYVEVPNLQNNLEAVLTVMRYIYDNILYAELNTKSDYCQVCGFDGEIQIVEDDDGKLLWECPNCGNRDQRKMNVARRTCGYIGTQYWNQGRTQEIRERVLHL